MDKLAEKLIQLADECDFHGKKECANAVDALIQSNSLHKLAQYVGVIGYVLKQNRAIEGCIRRKRVAENGPMQEVVLSCLKEYQDGQDYQDNEWVSKYAQLIRANPDNFSSSHLSMLHKIAMDDNITEGIEKVEKVAQTLIDNNIDIGILDTTLSHLSQLGEILRKDAAKHFPFD